MPPLLDGNSGTCPMRCNRYPSLPSIWRSNVIIGVQGNLFHVETFRRLTGSFASEKAGRSVHVCDELYAGNRTWDICAVSCLYCVGGSEAYSA